MIDYAEIADVKTFARQPDALSNDGWQLLVTSASRLFDIVCEVETDFFARPGNPQYFDGNDSQLLPILPLTDSRTIKSVEIENDVYPVPDYAPVIVENVTALITETGKWHSGTRVIVRAGWAPLSDPAEAAAAIPKDINWAVIEMAIHIWRKGDPSFASISSAENSILLDELPPTARATVEKYRAMYSNRCLFA